MTPCQKKLDWPSVVAAPGNSQSISSLMSDIVMKAVTTPAQRPVLTARVAKGSTSLQLSSRRISRTPSGNSAVVDVVSGRETSTAVVLGEGHGHRAASIVQDGARVDDPVVFGCITVEVRRVREDAGGIGKGILKPKKLNLVHHHDSNSCVEGSRSSPANTASTPNSERRSCTEHAAMVTGRDQASIILFE